MKLIALLLTFTLTAAACPDYQPLKAGDKSPCDGHFFNNQTENSIRKDIRDYKLTQKQIELKDLQLRELEQDRDKWAKEAHNQAKARHEQDNDMTYGVIAGIGLTLAVMFGVGQVSK